MSTHLRAWLFAAPATLLVFVFLGLPVLATFLTTFGDPKGPFSTYAAFFNSKRAFWRGFMSTAWTCAGDLRA